MNGLKADTALQILVDAALLIRTGLNDQQKVHCAIGYLRYGQ